METISRTSGTRKGTLEQGILMLIVILVVSASLLVLINYFTIKTLSAVRAYTNGESLYSKGQKDAARQLILYVNSGDESYWRAFQEELKVPLGDSAARVLLTQNGNVRDIKQNFLAGRNHEDDLDDLIWLFQNFREVPFMSKAIQIWKEADYLIAQKNLLALEVRDKIKAGTLTPVDQSRIIEQINTITSNLTLKERDFAETLGMASRKINSYLFVANVVMILLIVGSGLGWAIVMVKRLRTKNEDLEQVNQQLDKFVYSASHDLRAPLTSLRGLIEIAKVEGDPGRTKEYLQLMDQSLNRQDQFIRDIIDFSKNKRAEVQLQEVDVKQLVEEVVSQHRFMDKAKEIRIRRDVRMEKFHCDAVRLRIVLGNLVSNAIKYSDDHKPERFIEIRAYGDSSCLYLEVADNGIGIKREYLDKIFEMFFGTESKKGTGLGLYITKEAVEKLNGTIIVNSQVEVGSKFVVSIPAPHLRQSHFSAKS